MSETILGTGADVEWPLMEVIITFCCDNLWKVKWVCVCGHHDRSCCTYYVGSANNMAVVQVICTQSGYAIHQHTPAVAVVIKQLCDTDQS